MVSRAVAGDPAARPNSRKSSARTGAPALERHADEVRGLETADRLAVVVDNGHVQRDQIDTAAEDGLWLGRGVRAHSEKRPTARREHEDNAACGAPDAGDPMLQVPRSESGAHHGERVCDARHAQQGRAGCDAAASEPRTRNPGTAPLTPVIAKLQLDAEILSLEQVNRRPQLCLSRATRFELIALNRGLDLLEFLVLDGSRCRAPLRSEPLLQRDRARHEPAGHGSTSPAFKFLTGTPRRTIRGLQDVPDGFHLEVIVREDLDDVLGALEVDRCFRSLEVVALRELFPRLVDRVVDLLQVDLGRDVERCLPSHAKNRTPIYHARVLPIDDGLFRRLHSQANAERGHVPLAPFSAALSASAGKALAASTPNADEVERYLTSLHLEDLALACGCAAGDEDAWEHFVREFRPRSIAPPTHGPDRRARELVDSLRRPVRRRQSRDRRQSLFRYFHGRSSLATGCARSCRSGSSIACGPPDATKNCRTRSPRRRSRRPSGMRTERDRDLHLLQDALAHAVEGLDTRDRLRLRCYYAQGLTLAEPGG